MIRRTNRRFQLPLFSVALALLAVMAVAVVHFPSGSDLAQAQGTCPYTQTPSGLGDLSFKHQQVTTWHMGKTNSFTLGGPYVGAVSVGSSSGIEVSTNQNFTCGNGGQSITIQKSSGPTEIHVQRCDAEQTHIEFATLLVDGCSGQMTTVYTWEWLEPTDAPSEVRQGGTQLPYHDTTRNGTCNTQDQNNGPGSPNALTPQGDTSIRGRWTGPNASGVEKVIDAMGIHREGIAMILKVRNGKATPAEAQEIADTLWLMSHEARKLPVYYEYQKTGKNKMLWELLRQWVTDEGLEPSEEARTAGVPWPVFYNRYGEIFTPKQARERYGGAPDGDIGLWRERNPVAWYQNDPGGLDEALVGPPKEHGEGERGDYYTEQDGTWITQAEAFSKYGIKPSGTTMEEWESSHNLTRLPEWIHPDEQPGQQSTQQSTQNNQCVPGQTTGQQQGTQQPSQPQTSNRCSGGAAEIVLTPDLNGVRNIDLAQFPGLDQYHPWHRERVLEWKTEAGIKWQKTASGYKDGTDAGIPSAAVSAGMPDAAASAQWSKDQWAEWNENRQAEGLRRVQIYERRCDKALLTEFQVHRMYGTPFEPIGFPDTFMATHDRWKEKGYWIVGFPWTDKVMLNESLWAVENAGLPLTTENVAAELATRLMDRWEILLPNEEERRERAEASARAMVIQAQQPEN